jgi:hypothetical protein
MAIDGSRACSFASILSLFFSVARPDPIYTKRPPRFPIDYFIRAHDLELQEQSKEIINAKKLYSRLDAWMERYLLCIYCFTAGGGRASLTAAASPPHQPRQMGVEGGIVSLTAADATTKIKV